MRRRPAESRSCTTTAGPVATPGRSQLLALPRPGDAAERIGGRSDTVGRPHRIDVLLTFAEVDRLTASDGSDDLGQPIEDARDAGRRPSKRPGLIEVEGGEALVSAVPSSDDREEVATIVILIAILVSNLPPRSARRKLAVEVTPGEFGGRKDVERITATEALDEDAVSLVRRNVKGWFGIEMRRTAHQVAAAAVWSSRQAHDAGDVADDLLDVHRPARAVGS